MTITEQTTIQAALFDIDGTLTTGGPVWKALIAAPDVPLWRKSWIYGTAFPHYMLSKAHIMDQAAFRDRWVRLMAWLMTGWSSAQVDAICDQIATGMLVPNLRPDVVRTLKQHSDEGHVVILVSTMFERIVARLVRHLGADAGLGSVVAFDGDRCRGRITGETCSGGRKLEFIQRHLSEHHPTITLAHCAAYADSGSDIPFLAGAAQPVAVYPDDAMREAAQSHHWAIHSGA